MHDCPECGQACYCGGDIDDINIDDVAAQEKCTHCLHDPPGEGWDYPDSEPIPEGSLASPGATAGSSGEGDGRSKP